MSISKFTAKVIGDKRRWREYKARTRQLPENYRAAVDAFERYLMYLGPADGDSAASMFEDRADLFEQSAADGTPIRAVVGDDPIEFIEAVLRKPLGERSKSRDDLAHGPDRHASIPLMGIVLVAARQGGLA